MNDSQLVLCAEEFLNGKGIAFVKPGKIGRRNNERVEVIFFIPEALDPDVVVDPPDIKVWVNVKTKKVTLIPQM